MKRHAALLERSREHHIALKMARRARFACDAGLQAAIADAAKSITEAFHEHIEIHFQAEERDLLPALAAVGEEELVRRTLEEHAELRRLNAALAEPDGDTLARFASLLNDHVRLEERELFEVAQQRLYPQTSTPPAVDD